MLLSYLVCGYQDVIAENKDIEAVAKYLCALLKRNCGGLKHKNAKYCMKTNK